MLSYDFILTPFLSLSSQPLLPSPLKLQNFTSPNEPLMSMCSVCFFLISFTYVIKSIDSKLISVCLIKDYSLIADLHILIYGRAECTKVKLLTLNNFGYRSLRKIRFEFRSFCDIFCLSVTLNCYL